MNDNPVFKVAAQAWKPADRRTPWKWAEENVIVDASSSMPGRWKSDTTPFVKEILECWQNNLIRQITMFCSAQSAKTQTMICGVLWAIAESPGPMLWALAAKDEAEQFKRDRFDYSKARCEKVKELIIDDYKRQTIFSTMPLYFEGAGSDSKFQSKPIRWLILDEVRNYPPGALQFALKRTRAHWNSKTVITSTPDMENDTVHRAFLEGDQRRWKFPCVACGELQEIKFSNLKWDETPETRPAGKWNIDALAPTIRLECVKCSHRHFDKPATRKHITRQGHFSATNPNAPADKVSFTWNALLPEFVRWKGIVEEFLNAREAAKGGDTAPMKAFINETLGEPWRDELGVVDDFKFLDARRGDYGFGDAWPEEVERIMAADRQEKGGEHYWYVIRAFGRFGKSRLVAYGKCNSTLELEQVRVSYGVKTTRALIDSGNKTDEVYRFCASNGWRPMKGDDAPFFITRDPADGVTYRRSWDEGMVDPAIGTSAAGRVAKIKLFRFAGAAVKDVLLEYLKGLAGEWTIPNGTGRDYLRQLSAEQRIEKTDHKGQVSFFWKRIRRDNHLFDCEVMVQVAAIMLKLTREKKEAPAAA